MALIKKIQLENGVTANYHNVIVYKDSQARAAKYQICSYVSKEMRSSDRKPVVITEMRTLPQDFYTGHIEKDVYNYLKTLDTFKNATDDEESYFILPSEDPEENQD